MRAVSVSLLLLLGVAIFLRVDFFFTIVYFFGAIFILARMWMQRSIRQLRLERRYLDRAFTGDDVRVELRLRNDGALPVPWLSVREPLPVELAGPSPQGQVISLGGREEWRHDYAFRARKRGYYNIGPLRAE